MLLPGLRSGGGAGPETEEAVYPGRWHDQPVDGKYNGEQLPHAAEQQVGPNTSGLSLPAKDLDRAAAPLSSPHLKL